MSVSPTTALNPLSLALRQTFVKGLDEHEAYCLAVVLQHNVITFTNSLVLGPFSAEEIQQLLNDQPQKKTHAFSPAWLEQLPSLLAQDIPLTNHDRLTSKRLSTALLAHADIHSIVPSDKSHAQVETADGTHKETEIP